jgi:DNA polymerase III epsilon subunit-like protein/8-oxo-dGTP pyrophosphatase MutT (NUDIX family)
VNNTNSVKHQVALLRVQARSIIDEANASMPAERQVHLKSALAVVKRSLNTTRSLAFEVREFQALRELSSFITLAQKNKSLNAQPKNTDLLPVGHPASTASHAMTASALRDAQIQWILSDNRISDEAKPLLASAFDAVPDSPEHKYAMTRLSLMKESRVPLEALVAAFGDGNSTLARRARAMLQKRDSKGRFAYQGGGISTRVKRISGVVERLTGKTVSSSPDGKTVRVELPDGRLTDVPIDSSEFIKAVINPSADGYSGVPAKYSSSDTVVDEASLQYFEAPHGFHPDDSHTGKGKGFTDDSYNVVKNEDGTFSISQRGTGVDLGTANSWSEVQKILQSDDANLAKAEGSQPIAHLTDQQINDMYDPSKNPFDIKSPFETPTDTTPAKGAPDGFEFSYPDGAYKLSPHQDTWEPEGHDGQDSPDYTDDPKVLAGKWKAEGLIGRLKMAILPQKEGSNATGYSPLPFKEGIEQVPAEAVYAALDEKGLDAKMEVAKIYDEALGTTENQDALTAAREAEKTVAPEATLPEDVTPVEPTKPKKKKEAPLPKPDVENLPLTTGQKIAWFVEAFSTKGGLLEGFLLTPKPTNQMIYEYVRDEGVPHEDLVKALEDAGIEIAPDPEADVTTDTPAPEDLTPADLVDGAPEPVAAPEPTNEPDVADIVDEISSGDLTDEEIQAMLDGEGIGEGDVPGVFIPSGSLQEIPFDTLKFVPNDPADPNGPGKIEKSSGTSNIIDYAGRKMVIVDVNGVKVPFYLSTGDGGKKNVPPGKWYPFLGVGSDNWINKDGQKMTDYYGSPELKAQAEWLDANIGDVRKDDTIPTVAPSGAHIDAINADLLPPTENGNPDTQTKIDASVADLVERVKTKDVATPEEVKSKKVSEEVKAELPQDSTSPIISKDDISFKQQPFSPEFGYPVFDVTGTKDALRAYLKEDFSSPHWNDEPKDWTKTIERMISEAKDAGDGKYTITNWEYEDENRPQEIIDKITGDNSPTPEPEVIQEIALPEGWSPVGGEGVDSNNPTSITKTLEDGTTIKASVNADGTYQVDNVDLPYSRMSTNTNIPEPITYLGTMRGIDKTHPNLDSLEQTVLNRLNEHYAKERSNIADALKKNMFDSETIDSFLNASSAEEAKKIILESERYKIMQEHFNELQTPNPYAATNTVASNNAFKKKFSELNTSLDNIAGPFPVDESKIDPILPQNKPEVLTPTNAPVAMTEKVGDPVKVTTSVNDLQAGDVLANDFFTVESVYSDAESEAKKPGSVWVTGYYPGHASQKTKLWNPSDSREVFRNVDVPAKGDLPELSKPFAKDYDPEGKVYKDTALDLFVPKDAEARSKYLDAVDQYNAKLAEAMGKWNPPADAPSHDATATDPSAPHKLSVPASDLQPGDIAFRVEDPGYSGGVLKEPYTNYFVIEEVFTDENTPAGKVNVRGYYPGHVSQVREWNKDTPIDAVRGDKNVPEKGDGPELVLKKQKEYPVDPTTKKMTPETRAEWLKNVEDFHAGAKASAGNYTDPVGDYVAGDTSPVSAVATAPKKPGRAPAQPAFQGDRLVELAKQANGDPKKFMELLSQEEIAFFDYETVGDGGFGPDSAPIQLAAHKVKDGKVVDSFDMFINPGKPLGEYYYTTDENGNKVLKGNLKTPDGEPVSDEWLAQQPTLEDAHKAFAEWLGEGAILGGQNIAGFDIPILKYQFNKAGLQYNVGGVVDTLPLAQSITKAPPHSKGVNTLEALAARYGIDLTNAHNAAADSLATHGVLFAMLDELSKTNDADGLTHLDPETKFAEYEGKFADWQAAREAFKAWTAAQALKDAEAKIAEGKPVVLDDIIKSASVPEVPNPDGIFNAKSDAINLPSDFPTGTALKDSPEWVKDDNNTTLIEDTIRPVDFKVGDFIPAEFGGFHEILSIEEDPNKKDFFNIATRVVGTDNTYVKNWFKYNKNYSGVRRPNNSLDGSEMPVIETPEASPEPMPEAPAKWNNYDIKQNDHGNFYADGITSEDAIKLRTGELQPPSLPFFVPMYGNTDPNSGEGDLYTEQSIAEGGPRKYWGQFGGAGILVRRKNADGNYEYLLARRQGTSSGSGKWAYFGGAHDTADAAKDPESTVLKELGEEAGIDLTGKATFVQTHDSTGDPNWSYKTLVADVSPDAIGPDDIKTNWEHSESGWFTADQIKDMKSQGALFGPFADNAEVIFNTSSDESNLPATPAPADAVATATPKELGTVFDVSGWKKVGEAGGSTGGAIYEDQNGNTFFVKPPNNVDDTSDPERHARNEALASALYEEAGVKSGRVFLGKDENGSTVLVSPWIDGSTKDFKDKLSDPAVLAKAQEAFAVDAWLMNWDSVGLGYDNMLMVNGDVVRVDPGGSLLYRARGKSKQDQMSDKVEELDSLRSGQNAQAAKVFGSMTDAQLADSAKLVQAITPERINQIVDAAFPDDKDTADFLKQKLTARRQDLIDRFNLSEPVTPASQPDAVAPSVKEATPEAPSGPEVPKADTSPATSIPKGQDSPAASSPPPPPPPPPPTPPAAGGSGGPDIHHLDPSGDMVQQIADAIKDGKLVAFKYHDKERLVTPHGTWENPQNGNINFSATDADGVKKNYTLSKIEKSDNAPTTVSETPSTPSTPNTLAPEAKPSLISNYPAPESVVSNMATDVDPKTQDNFNALKKNIEQLFDGVTVEVSDNKIVVIDNDTAGYIALVRNSDGSLSEVGTAGVYDMDPQIIDTHSDYVDAENAVMDIVESQFDVKGTGKKVDQFPDSDKTPSNADEVIAMGEAMKNIYGDSNTVTVTEDYFRVTTPEGDMVTVLNQGDGTFDVVAFGGTDEAGEDPIDIGQYDNLGDATNALHDAMTAIKYNNFGDNPIPVPELLTGSDEDNDSPISDIINDALDGTTPEIPSVDEIVNEIKAENGPKAITDPNLIVEALKKNYPDNYTLSNGDLVVRSKTVNGSTYETVVRRNANETFSVYLRETNGATGAIREVHYAANRHSDLAVNNLIARRNATLDKFADPKKWFTQKKASTPEVSSTEAPQNTIESAVQDVVNPEFPMTGDIMIDGLLKVVEAAANEPGGIQKVLDSLQNMPGISKETYDNLMGIVNTALAKQTAVAPAKGEETKKPHISKDGVTPVKVGDTVRWEKTKDGVVVEVQIGIVEQLKSEQISVNEFGQYVFSDYVKVRVPGKKKLQTRVASNLDILSSVPDAEAVDGPVNAAEITNPILPASEAIPSGPSGLKPKVQTPNAPEAPSTPEAPNAPLGKIYLDPDGDLKAQIQDAIDNQREISFLYGTKERSFIPEAVYTHDNTGNDLVNGIDDGTSKKFNLAKIEKSADFQPYTPSPEKPKTEATPDEVKTVDPATVIPNEVTVVTPDSVSPLGNFAYFNVDGQEILVPNSIEGFTSFWQNQDQSAKPVADIVPGESILSQNTAGIYEIWTVLKKEVSGNNTSFTVVQYKVTDDVNQKGHQQKTLTFSNDSSNSLSVLSPKDGGNGGGGTPPEPDPINPTDGPATVQETADILGGLSDSIKNDPAMSGVDTDAMDQAVDAATKFDESQNAPQAVTDAPDVAQLPLNEESLDTLKKYIEDFVIEPGLTTVADIKPGQVVVVNSGNSIYVTSVKQNKNFSGQIDVKGINLKNGNEFSTDWSKTTTVTLSSHKDVIGADPYAQIPLVTLEETKNKKNFTNIKKTGFSGLQVGDIVVKKAGPYGYSYQILAIPPKNSRGSWNDVIYRVIAHNPESPINGKVKKDDWYNNGFKGNGFNNVKRPNAAWLDAGKKKSGYTEPEVVPTITTKKAPVVGKVQTFSDINALTADAVGKKDFAFFDAFGATTYDSSYGEADVSFKDGAAGFLVKDSGGSGSGKNMVPGMVITDANGNAGILTNTQKASEHENSTVDVTWLSGPDAGTSQTGLKAFDVTSAEKFINYDKAAELGVDVNSEVMDKIKAKTAVVAEQKAKAIAEKKIKEAEKAAIDKMKKDNSAKGSGADPVLVEGPADWFSSDFSDVPSLVSVIDIVQKDIAKSSVGVQTLVDSDQIEDNKVRVYRVKDKNGNWQTRVRFKLTDWAGVSKAEEMIADGTKKSSKLNFRKFEKQSDGSLKADGSHGSNIDNNDSGTTYSLPITDEQGSVIGEVLIHRATKDASTLNYLQGTNSGYALSYNNEVDIYLPDNATPKQIETALKTAGVDQVRPATKADILVTAENKIISMFGNKADGAYNYKGELRDTILKVAKDKYGINAADIKPEFYNGTDITLVLPDDVAENLANITNAAYFNHSLTSSNTPTSGKKMADWLFHMLTKDSLRPTVERWASGIQVHGQSSSADGYAVGANYVFTAKSTSANRLFSFDGKKMMRRLDFYVNNYDGWGKKHEQDNIEMISASSVTEVLFKGAISWADLAYINVDSATRDILIEMLTKAGITELGGKPVDSVVRNKNV